MDFHLPPDFWAVVTALVISSISIAISILKRIEKQAKSKLWLVSEYAAGVLTGYLAYDAYPVYSAMKYFPEWMTMPICIAVAAHSGGRLLQVFEYNYRQRLIKLLQGESNSDG